MFFDPISLSNLLKVHPPGIKGAMPAAPLCIENFQLHSSKNHILPLLELGYLPVKSRLTLTNSNLKPVTYWHVEK